MKSSPPRNLNAIPSSIIDKSLITSNENYNLLMENRQYTLLNQLDRSIDIQRFKTDDEYRRLTILGLFMCDDPSFDYAEQLAIKSNISIDECHHSYFEHLLTNSNLSLNEIRKKIKPFLNSERMKKNRQIKLDLVKRLHSHVFPLISGKDYERLKLFYDIKKSLGDSTQAQKHIQAIQQLVQILNYGKREISFFFRGGEKEFVFVDFDYKQFLSKPESFLENYANDSNIINLGLVLDQLKISSAMIVTSNWIYSHYLRLHSSSTLIFDLLNRITSFEDFQSLLQHLINTRDLSIPRRIEIIEFSLQLILAKDDQQWKLLDEFLKTQLARLQVYRELLDEYSEEEFNRLDQADDPEEILADLLIQHRQFHLITFFKTRLFSDLSIDRILRLTIERFSQQIKSSSSRSTDIEHQLNGLLESISLNEVDEKEIFSSFEQLCRSENIDRRIRYKIIDKLDKVPSLRKNILSSHSFRLDV